MYMVWIKVNGRLEPHLYHQDNKNPDGKNHWETLKGTVVRVHSVKETHKDYPLDILKILYTAYN